MTDGILESIKQRDTLFDKQNADRDDDEISQKYRRYRNKVNRIVDKARELYEYNLFDKVSDDSKKTWNELNKYFKKKSSSSSLPTELQVGEKKYTNPKPILDNLNDYLAKKGHNLASNLPQPTTSIYDSLGSPCFNDMKLTKIKTCEISDIIKNDLQNHKSPGYDNVHAVLIKWSSHIISPILEKIFNRFFDIGDYPDYLKIAKVTALHKGGDASLAENYRPISVLPHINKIFEKLIHVRMSDHIEKQKILSNSQFGFRKGHSTSHGISNLQNKIIEHLEKKNICAVLFIDLKSAFDTIDPDILIKKLQHYGFRGKISNLLKSYLTGRKQFIQYGTIESELLEGLCGVPQGSVLGPLLFILYIMILKNVVNLRLCCLLMMPL